MSRYVRFPLTSFTVRLTIDWPACVYVKFVRMPQVVVPGGANFHVKFADVMWPFGSVLSSALNINDVFPATYAWKFVNVAFTTWNFPTGAMTFALAVPTTLWEILIRACGVPEVTPGSIVTVVKFEMVTGAFDGTSVVVFSSYLLGKTTE